MKNSGGLSTGGWCSLWSLISRDDASCLHGHQQAFDRGSRCCSIVFQKGFLEQVDEGPLMRREAGRAEPEAAGKSDV